MKLYLLIFPLINVWGFSQVNEIEEVKNLILPSIWNGLTYKLDTDAKRYQPTNSTASDYGTFDFVIIGAGTAGSIIANRLSENKNWKVLLIEAGKYGNNVTDSPAMAFFSMLSDYNWGFFSEPQKAGCLGMVGQRCPFPRGRGVGGTSLINLLMQARGNPADYDKWAKMGNSGWSYKDVLPYFKKLENFHKDYEKAPVNWDYHGKHGETSIVFGEFTDLRYNIFKEAHKELGLPYTDYNSPEQIGTSPIQFFKKENGNRHDTGDAYIKPILSRKNLVVLTESYVVKIDINSTKTAKGVYFTRNQKLFHVKASKEVILSAGAFQSPQLLMLSGVGPKDHLIKHGIKVIKNLSVGDNLRNHISIFLFLTGNFNDLAPATLIQDLKDYVNSNKEFLVTATKTITSVSFLKRQNMTERPDVQLIAIPGRYNALFAMLPLVFRYSLKTVLETAFSLLLKQIFALEHVFLHPKSTGTIKLKSSSPYDYPLIDPNIFSDSKDFDRMYEGLEETFKVINTEAFKKYNIKIAPIKYPSTCGSYQFKSKEFWKCYTERTVYPFHHPTGSCGMGPDPKNEAVVDHQLNVHGVKNLRVADASVVPVTISGNTAAIAMVVGEKAADLIKEKYQ